MSTHALNPLRAVPVLMALIFNVVIGPLAPVAGPLLNGTVHGATGTVVEVDNNGNSCNGVKTTPGSENTTKELVGGTLEPGGSATFRFTFPATVQGNPGQEEWKLTDCVFINDTPLQKFEVTALSNDVSPVVIEFTLNIPADAPIGSEYCNYGKTTETPSDSQASNRKAGPACFVIGGAIRVLKVNAAQEALAGATFDVSCQWPDVTAGTFLPDTILSVPTNGSIAGGGSSETINSTDNGSFTRTVVTGDEGAIAVNGPDGTVCTFTETAAPEGYKPPEPPDNTVTLTIAATGEQATHTFVNVVPTGNLTVVKDLNPSDDPGLFNLQIDGSTLAANVGDGGTTGAQTLNTGSYDVGETAGTATELANYTSSIDCLDGATSVASGTGAGPLSVDVTDGSDIVCTITNTRKTGDLTVVKSLSPSDDPGLFNLQIDGTTQAANVGDGGTTGAQTVNTGSHTVGETAGTSTALANYASSIECVDGETVVASGSGTGPLSVDVTDGSNIVCTITNTRVTVGLTKTNDKGENPTVEPGETVHYTITVTVNNGTATGVVVTDTLPAGLTYVADSADPSAGFSISADGRHLQWTVGSLNEGSHTYEYDATVDANASGSLKNLGCVDADQNDLLVCDETTVLVQRLSIEKTNDTTGSVVPGTAVNYELTLTVENGPIDSATIVDQLPTGIDSATGISDGGTYDATANAITWNLSDVADGDTLTYTATVNATATAGNYVNVATITEGPCVGDDCTDDSTVTVRIPTLTIEKVANVHLITISGPANAQTASPSTVTWSLTYTLANGPVTNAVITDVVPTGFTFLSAANGGTLGADGKTVTWNLGTLSASGSVSFVTTVNVATISRTGPTENVAVIKSDQTPSDEGKDSVRVTVIPPPLAGNPPPPPKVPNTAVAFGPGGQPVNVPIELLVMLFLGSLGGLAFANVRAVQRRRR